MNNKIFLNEREIQELCCWPANPKRYTDFSEMSYSQGYWLKKFLFYPHFLDMYVTLEHGYYFDNDEMSLEDIVQDTNVLFSIYKKYKIQYKKNYISGSPFIWYRRKYNIKPCKPKYILAFPHHSLTNVNKLIRHDEYIIKLRELEKQYNLKILVCIYFRDVHKGIHKLYIDAGFDITTVGHGSRYDFIPRFYEILKYAKFTTSNIMGSYVIYSIEMGIPFLLYGHPYYNVKPLKEYINGYEVKVMPTKLDLSIFECINIDKQYKYLEKIKMINNDTYSYKNRIILSFIMYKEFFRFSLLKLKRTIFKFYLEYIYQPNVCLNLGTIEGYKKRYIEYIFEKYNLVKNDIKYIDNFNPDINENKKYKLILIKIKVNYLGDREFIDKTKDERYLYENLILKIYKILDYNGFLFIDYADSTPIKKILKKYDLQFKIFLSYKNFIVARKILC